MTAVGEFLDHHGVKGMKWGVRNDRGHRGEPVKLKKLPKLDRQFEQNAYSAKTWFAIHNRAADLVNAHDIHRINNKPEYKNAVFDHNYSSPLAKKYVKEHQDAFLQRVNEATGEIVGSSNPSGKKKVGIIVDSDGNWGVAVRSHDVKTGDNVSSVLRPVKHAATDENIILTIKVERDNNGHITGLSVMPIQHDNMLEDFLEHHGVKGMHWGVRNKRTRKETRIRNKRQQIANRRRQISDSDLEKFIKRLDNEKKLKTLTDNDLKPGRSAAKKIAGDTGKKIVSTVAAGAAVIVIKAAVEKKLSPKGTKIKLNPKDTADILVRGGLKKK